jgi:hypothetical protein
MAENKKIGFTIVLINNICCLHGVIESLQVVPKKELIHLFLLLHVMVICTLSLKVC